MKRLMKLVVAMIMVFAMLAPVTLPVSGTVAVAEAATVKISKTKLSMEIGKTATLKISGTKSKITWKTDKKAVATVTSKGVVTAQSAGTAKITATVDKKNYICKITVNKAANLYQVSADFEEVRIEDLSVVVPTVYDVTVEEVAAGSYKAKMKIPDSKSSITVIVNKTGEAALSFEEIEASFEGLSEDYLQAKFDDVYGAGKAVVSDLNTFSYESQNGTISYVYSLIIETSIASARQISYNLSVDDYSLEVIVVDSEGYDVYIDAEYLIDSLMMYIVE
ncbi:MAG: Ig-like domain-containing protein [Mobilitalea sp.]